MGCGVSTQTPPTTQPQSPPSATRSASTAKPEDTPKKIPEPVRSDLTPEQEASDVPLAPVDSMSQSSAVEIRPSPNSFYDRYREDVTIQESERVISLPRGGKIVRTSAGDIQFGVPPETIKDSMKLGLTVPNNFVITGEMFDRALALSVAEFEFPAYFNFFIRKQKVNLIIMADLEERIRAIFKETLLGPDPEFLRLDEDFDEGMPKDAHPNFREEGIFLDPARRNLTVDTLLTFTVFDPDKLEVELPGGVKVKYDLFSQTFMVYEDRKELAEVDARHRGTEGHLDAGLVRQPFDIPVFGVTMLGTSHGFDKDGTTTGFVLWVNRRGLMVDPPPLSNMALEELGIPARFIEGVVLTHCHADHDAGSFQKILKERSVRMFTTTTIFESFMRKYGAISGFQPAFLKGLVEYRPVKVGRAENFHDASLNFFYSFHVIPTVGFEVHYKNDSIIYSADTNSTPSLIRNMRDSGAVGGTRFDMLMNTPLSGNHTLILHEAGVPPIHTPIALLEALPQSVMDRLHVVHTNALPKNPKLQLAKEWDTFCVDVGASESQGELARLVDSMDVFTGLRLDTHAAALEVLAAAPRQKFKEGETVLAAGEVCAYLYFITAGAAVESGSTWHKRHVVGDVFGKAGLLLYDNEEAKGGEGGKEGGGGGEEEGGGRRTAAVGGRMMRCGRGVAPVAAAAAVVRRRPLVGRVQAQCMLLLLRGGGGAVVKFPVVATTELHVFKVLAADLIPTLAGTDVVAKVRRQEAMKTKDSWPVLTSNALFKKFTNEQIGGLQSILSEPVEYQQGEYVWVPNIPAEEALLILEGTLEFVLDSSNAEEEDGENLSTFRGNHNALSFISMLVGRGTFIADVNALMKEHASLISLEVMDTVKLLKVAKKELLEFFQAYPGVMVHLLDVHVVTVDAIQ